MSRLYSYVLRWDDGAAPNPFWNLCSLVICKPAIRRTAVEGDWIAGTGSKNTPVGDMSSKLVYAMRVTRKMTMDQYDAFARKENTEKIPSHRSKDWRRWLGDSIYDYSVTPPRQRLGVHGPDDIARDLSGEFALVSDDFAYLGDQATTIPDHLRPIVQQTQGHRSTLNEPYVERFVEWIRTLQGGRGSLLGNPQYMPSRPPSADSVCSIGRREEDSHDDPNSAAATDWTFAYGSNMKISDLDADLRGRADGAECIVETLPAFLRGWRLVWNYFSKSRACGAANIEPAADDELPGVVMRLTNVGLKALDRKEGHRKDISTSSYRRQVGPIRLKSGETVNAWVYVARPEMVSESPQWPSRAYRQLLIDGAIENDLPEAHIQALKAIRTCD